jgi:hypothetical protein
MLDSERTQQRRSKEERLAHGRIRSNTCRRSAGSGETKRSRPFPSG